LCILEGLIPNEDNEHKESTYERSNSAMGQAPDAPPLEIPELALDLKGFLKALFVVSIIRWFVFYYFSSQ
jgi:hypothetical protein